MRIRYDQPDDDSSGVSEGDATLLAIAYIGANAYAWYDAEDLEGSGDGASVAQWDDKTGNARHLTQATPANRPLIDIDGLNDLVAVRFNPSIPSWLNYPSGFLTVATSGEMFSVQKHNNPGSGPTDHNYGPYNLSGGTESDEYSYPYEEWVGSSFLSSTVRSSNSLDPEPVGNVVNVYANSSNQVYYHNGTLHYSVAHTFNAAAANRVMGRRNTSGADYWDGWISEHIVFDYVLDAYWRNIITQYLSAKWRPILTEDGNILTDENGNPLTLEGP